MANKQRSCSIMVFADYRQVYVHDASFDFAASAADWFDWTGTNAENRVAAAPGMLNICTARNVDVQVRIEVFDAEPPLDVEAWDQVVEAGIALSSGQLTVSSPLGENALSLAVDQGQYCSRVFFGGLHTLSDDGLLGQDHYLVQLWPGRFDGVAIRKRDLVSCGGFG
jgi:hypothetical protein